MRMTNNITANQKRLLNDHAKEIKVGNFKNLIYEGWKYSIKTIVGAIQLLREAGVYPFNQTVLQSEDEFKDWISKMAGLGQFNDYTEDLVTVPPNESNAKNKLTIAEALGTSCYKIANFKSPYYGTFMIVSRYFDIEMLLDSHSGWFPGVKVVDLTREF